MKSLLSIVKVIAGTDNKTNTKDEDYPVEVKFSGLPPTMPVYSYRGEYISEHEYRQIIEQKHEIEAKNNKLKKREENIAAIKRRFENYEEILEVIEQLSDEDKDHALDFLVSLRKKQRDELNWEEYKNKLLLKRRD